MKPGAAAIVERPCRRKERFTHAASTQCGDVAHTDSRDLVGPDPADLVITYATNSLVFGDLFTPRGRRSLYWPRFVAVPVGERGAQPPRVPS